MSTMSPEAANSLWVTLAKHGTEHGDILPHIQSAHLLMQKNPGLNIEIATIAGQDIQNVISQYDITHYQTFGEMFHGIGDVNLNTPRGMTDAIKLNGTYLATGMAATILKLIVDSRIEGRAPVMVVNQPMLIPTLPQVWAFAESTKTFGGGLVVSDFNTLLADPELAKEGTGSQIKNNAFDAVFKGLDWWYGVSDHLKDVSKKGFNLVLDLMLNPNDSEIRQSLAYFGIDNYSGIKIDRTFDLRYLEQVAHALQDSKAQSILAEIAQDRANWDQSIENAAFKLPESYRIYATNPSGRGIQELSDKVIKTERIKYEEERELDEEEETFLNTAYDNGKDVVVISFSSQPHLPEGITKKNQQELTWLLEEVAKKLEGQNVSLFYVNSMKYGLDSVHPSLKSDLFLSEGRVPLGKVLRHRSVIGGVHHAGQGTINTFDETGKWSVATPYTQEQVLNRDQLVNAASNADYSMVEMMKDKASFVRIITEAAKDVLDRRLDQGTEKPSAGSALLAEALTRVLGRIFISSRKNADF